MVQRVLKAPVRTPVSPRSGGSGGRRSRSAARAPAGGTAVAIPEAVLLPAASARRATQKTCSTETLTDVDALLDGINLGKPAEGDGDDTAKEGRDRGVAADGPSAEGRGDRLAGPRDEVDERRGEDPEEDGSEGRGDA